MKDYVTSLNIARVLICPYCLTNYTQFWSVNPMVLARWYKDSEHNYVSSSSEYRNGMCPDCAEFVHFNDGLADSD